MDLYSEERYLKMDECKHGHLYLILSRNLWLGVYSQTSSGFSGIRTKFGDRYIFEEFHWDTGAPFGTVKPIKELELYDLNFDEREGIGKLFEWLEIKQSQYREFINEFGRERPRNTE